jgi:hypothetical protein
MEKSGEDDLIPVYIFREMIPDRVINEHITRETGLIPEHYQNQINFETIIMPEIIREVESRVGIENAHMVDSEIQMSLVDLVAHEVVDTFVAARRSILEREYTASNVEFVDRHIDESREIIYNSIYTTTLIVEATPAEIREYAALCDVSSIMYHDVNLKAGAGSTSSILTLVGVDDGNNGTKGPNYFNGLGLRGNGIRIGVIEPGRYTNSNANNAHIANLGSHRLEYVPNFNFIPILNTEVDRHAANVITIIVGRSASGSVNGSTYTFEGVVPNAKVYQTSINYNDSRGVSKSLYEAFETLAKKNVNIINASIWIDEPSGYSAIDMQIDRLIACTWITFVTISGNFDSVCCHGVPRNSHEVTTPGRALNAITVGNLQTKSSASQVINTSQFSLNPNSCFRQSQNFQFPNKPDIVAPGTFVTKIVTSGTWRSSIGTSFAAPLVTGAIAQAMQESASLRAACPWTVKALVILGADANRVTSTTTYNEQVSNTGSNNRISLKTRSGAGLLSAPGMLRLRYNFWSGFLCCCTSSERTFVNLRRGNVVRAVLVVGKTNNGGINSENDLDRVNMRVLRVNNNFPPTEVAFTISSIQNVKIIEFEVPANANYIFEASAEHIRVPNAAGCDLSCPFRPHCKDSASGVPYSMIWRVLH